MAWSPQEWILKVSQVRELLEKEQLQGVLITKGVNFTWLTGGRPYVNFLAEGACAQIWIDSKKTILISNNIEAQRLVEEELGQISLEVISLPWWEGQPPSEIADKLSEGKSWKTDDQISSFPSLRWTLNPYEIDRYRKLGQDGALLLETIAAQIEPGLSEIEMARMIRSEGLNLSIEAPVTLVATDERAFLRRHPLPTEKKLDKLAMLVISGLRDGLFLSLTRMVHFGEPTEEVITKHQAILQVEAEMLAATQVGITAEELFEITKKAYSQVGYEDQWQFHHQGGLAGYQSREYRIQPGNKNVFAANQAFAWNPTIGGVKSEDTVLLGSNGLEILSGSQKFPTIEVSTQGQNFLRPALWIR